MRVAHAKGQTSFFEEMEAIPAAAVQLHVKTIPIADALHKIRRQVFSRIEQADISQRQADTHLAVIENPARTWLLVVSEA